MIRVVAYYIDLLKTFPSLVGQYFCSAEVDSTFNLLGRIVGRPCRVYTI